MSGAMIGDPEETVVDQLCVALFKAVSPLRGFPSYCNDSQRFRAGLRCAVPPGLTATHN